MVRTKKTIFLVIDIKVQVLCEGRKIRKDLKSKWEIVSKNFGLSENLNSRSVNSLLYFQGRKHAICDQYFQVWTMSVICNMRGFVNSF